MSQTYSIGTADDVILLNAVTATTNGPAIAAHGADRISVEFTRADHSAGSSAFKVQGSVDGGTTWHDLELLAKDGSKTRAVTVTLSANGSELHDVDMEHCSLTHIRGVVTETTDGTHTAKAVIKF